MKTQPQLPPWMRGAVRDGVVTPDTAYELMNRMRSTVPAARLGGPPPPPPGPPMTARTRRVTFGYIVGLVIGFLAAGAIALSLVAIVVYLFRFITGT